MRFDFDVVKQNSIIDRNLFFFFLSNLLKFLASTIAVNKIIKFVTHLLKDSKTERLFFSAAGGLKKCKEDDALECRQFDFERQESCL